MLARYSSLEDGVVRWRLRWDPAIRELTRVALEIAEESMGWKVWDVRAARVDRSPRVVITCEIELQTSDAEEFVKKQMDLDEKLKEQIFEQATGKYEGEVDFLIRNVETAVKNRLPKLGTPYA